MLKAAIKQFYQCLQLDLKIFLCISSMSDVYIYREKNQAPFDKFLYTINQHSFNNNNQAKSVYQQTYPHYPQI